MSTLFITATDTGAGKTTIACALLRALRARGVSACGFKPVASGAEPGAEGLRSDDALALIAAGGVRTAYDDVNPYTFAPAIAPHLAAEAAGVSIARERLDLAHDRLAKAFAHIVAEGAGGWFTPLSRSDLLGDWVAARGWPVLMVVGMRLGCLNHALLSQEAILRRTRLAGWVANVGTEPMPELQANISTLSDRLGPPLWVHATQGEVPATALKALFGG